jgi:hypothetical protein
MPAEGPVAELDIRQQGLLRFARNDKQTRILSLRGAQRRSNLYFGNKHGSRYPTAYKMVWIPVCAGMTVA